MGKKKKGKKEEKAAKGDVAGKKGPKAEAKPPIVQESEVSEVPMGGVLLKAEQEVKTEHPITQEIEQPIVQEVGHPFTQKAEHTVSQEVETEKTIGESRRKGKSKRDKAQRKSFGADEPITKPSDISDSSAAEESVKQKGVKMPPSSPMQSIETGDTHETKPVSETGARLKEIPKEKRPQGKKGHGRIPEEPARIPVQVEITGQKGAVKQQPPKTIVQETGGEALPMKSKPSFESKDKQVPVLKPKDLKVEPQKPKKSPLETMEKLNKDIPPYDEGLLPPQRKGFGTLGKQIKLRANHFQVKFDPTKVIHHYDIDIKPAIVAMKQLKRNIFGVLIKDYKIVFARACCVFDGEKNMYSNSDLQFPRQGKIFEVKLPDKNRERSFEVGVKKVGEVKLHELQLFLEGRSRHFNQTAIQALDIVMRHLSSSCHLTIGRSVFPHSNDGRSLGGGVEMWRGFYQSLRPQWKMLQLNLDVSNRSFYKEQNVLDFVMEFFEIREIDALRRWNMLRDDKDRLSKEVKGLKIEVFHTPIKRTYKIIGLSEMPAEYQTFPLTVEGGATHNSTVGKYFLDTYKKRLSFPNLPCLQAQPADKHRYLPMEVCRIPRGQQCKKLSEIQTANMIRAAAAPPQARERDIKKMINNINFKQDTFVKDFGLSLNDSLMQVKGRVLPSPQIEMHSKFTVYPRDGVWDMRRSRFHNPVNITQWCLLLFVDKRRFANEDVRNFTYELKSTGQNVGISIDEPAFSEYCRNIDAVKPVFKMIPEKYPRMQLILVILPGKTPIYAEVKRCGDNMAGISTQCIQMKNAVKANAATLTNIFMKINAKLGGINSIVHCHEKTNRIFQKPVIILGADVTHPPAGDKTKPSIAAVIGSLDRSAVKYKAKICVQGHRVETITNLKEKVKELLLAFNRTLHVQPLRIIFYRDGVGEGQFYEILKIELTAIRQACQSLSQNYKPAITFIVVQKRHHTRLFCDENEGVGKAKNVPPGTTVDQDIVHPIENDFYLCSHNGIQGTSRPTHYHVLWDDSDFSADELQQLTYELCHTYVRCTRSVSIPSPAYYAHLAAFRARHHLENLQRDYDRIGGDEKEWFERMQKAVETHEKLGNMYFA